MSNAPILPCFLHVFIGLLAVGNANGLAQEGVEEGDLINKEVVHATLPDVRPAPVEGFDSEDAYVKAMREQSDSLLKRAAEEREETVRVDAWLSAANNILAHELEPACTRRFHRLESAGAPDGDLTAALRRADDALEKAAQTLETLRARETTDADWLAAATRRQRILTGFARGLGEYLDPAAGDDKASRARDAASALAVIMEENDEGIAAAATLWHAALRSRAEEPAAALAVLPETAATASKAALPYAYFARLLRSELIARRGGHAAALALLNKMDDSVGVWFAQGTPRDEAMRALAWTKLRVLNMWREELSKSPDRAEEAAWCAERMQAIIADRFPEDRRNVLRVRPAIPLIAEAVRKADNPALLPAEP